MTSSRTDAPATEQLAALLLAGWAIVKWCAFALIMITALGALCGPDSTPVAKLVAGAVLAVGWAYVLLRVYRRVTR